jgi:oligopeptide transport system substrate-binding protein
VDALTVENASTAFNLYEVGAADLLTAVPLALVAHLRSRPDFHSRVLLGTYFLRFNVTHSPFTDPRVRRAFSLAVDRRRLVEYILKGGERPARSFVPPGIPGYEPFRGPRFDPEKARAFLVQAGYPDGRGFPAVRFLYNAAEGDRDVAEVLQSMWEKELGVRVELGPEEWKVYLSSMKALRYDIARSSWYGDYCDPNTFLDLFVTGGGNNRTGWGDPRYDALIEKAAREGDPVRRCALFREAERMLLQEEAVLFPAYFFAANFMFRPHVKGVRMNLMNELSLKDIYIFR